MVIRPSATITSGPVETEAQLASNPAATKAVKQLTLVVLIAHSSGAWSIDYVIENGTDRGANTEHRTDPRARRCKLGAISGVTRSTAGGLVRGTRTWCSCWADMFERERPQGVKRVYTPQAAREHRRAVGHAVPTAPA